MTYVIRMKTVSRVLIFLASLIVWTVVFSVLNATVLNVEEYFLLASATVVGALTTWVVALALGT